MLVLFWILRKYENVVALRLSVIEKFVRPKDLKLCIVSMEFQRKGACNASLPNIFVSFFFVSE